MKKLVFFALFGAIMTMMSCGNSTTNESMVDTVDVDSNMIDTIDTLN